MRTPTQIRRGLFRLLGDDYTPRKIRERAFEYHKQICIGSTDYETINRFLEDEWKIGRDKSDE